VVLVAHTAAHLNGIYDSIRDTVRDSNGGLYLNIIPLHGTPTDDGAAPFSIGSEQIVDALYKNFEHWLDDPAAIQLTPVRDYYLNIVRKLFNSPRSYFDRRSYGESSLIINTDGHVYLFREAYERDKSLGCLFEKTFAEITGSQAYAESLDRQDALAARCCGGCPYDGFCNREPLFNGPREESGERCVIGYPLHQRIERTLAARGFTPEVVRGNLTSLPQAHFITRQSQAAAAGG
jgi:sulfatase maturation enzyme AslB (radical SAM superfamily)